MSPKPFVLAVLAWAALGAPEAARAEVRLAVNPRLSATEMAAMFAPLVEYLGRATGEKVTLVIPRDFQAFRTAVAAGEVDLGYANPLQYVQLRRDAAVDLLAIASEVEVGTRFRGVIVARRDSGITSVAQLRGKRVIFVDRDSAAAYIFPVKLLRKAGLDPDRDMTVLPFAKKHDNVMLAVFNRAADAGAIREPDLARLKDKVDLEQIRVVAFTDTMPNWPVFATGRLGAAVRQKLKDALLRLAPGGGESDAVLRAAGLNGFAAAADRDFDALREAARAVGAF